LTVVIRDVNLIAANIFGIDDKRLADLIAGPQVVLEHFDPASLTHVTLSPGDRPGNAKLVREKSVEPVSKSGNCALGGEELIANPLETVVSAGGFQ
jgi:hypothetical protein